MRFFRHQTEPREVGVPSKFVELLTAHGLPPDTQTYVTIVSGSKGLFRDVGRTRLEMDLSCQECEPRASWAKGDLVTERHWSPGCGLSLVCPAFEFAGHLSLAAISYRGLNLVEHRRLALVSVAVSDLVMVQTEPSLARRMEDEGIPLEDVPKIAPLHIKTRKLKVLDVIDALRLVPEKSLLDAIYEGLHSEEWSREWHRLLDAMQPLDWRQFRARFAAGVQRLGLS